MVKGIDVLKNYKTNSDAPSRNDLLPVCKECSKRKLLVLSGSATALETRSCSSQGRQWWWAEQLSKSLTFLPNTGVLYLAVLAPELSVVQVLSDLPHGLMAPPAKSYSFLLIRVLPIKPFSFLILFEHLLPLESNLWHTSYINHPISFILLFLPQALHETSVVQYKWIACLCVCFIYLFLIYFKFIYFWLCWVFVAACGFL